MNICRNCGVCCHDTELELSEEDISRIKKVTGMEREDFSIFENEMWRLKNVDGHCVFLEPENQNHCKIYSNRPFGCTTYPMVYDIDDDSCWIDEDCPHGYLFYKNRDDFKRNCRKLRTWIKKNFDLN